MKNISRRGRKEKDISGMRFDRLVAIRSDHAKKKGYYFWLFLCDCGKEKVISKASVIAKIVVSCGCYGKQKRLESKRSFKHGKTGSKVYYTWQSMKGRCFNPKQDMFPKYGGRGIKICDRWLKFENFLEDMGEPPTQKHSIDRIDNNGNYEPTNCRWATNKEQSRNRSVTKFATYKGETKSVLDWCEELGLSYNLTRERLSNGWTAERAFQTPRFWRGERKLIEKGLLTFNK